MGWSVLSSASNNSNTSDMKICMGAADDRGEQWAVHAISDHNRSSSHCFRASSSSRFMIEMNADNGNSEGANHVNFVSNGVEFINDEAFTDQNQLIYMAARGPRHRVGSVVIPPTLTTFNFPGAQNFVPRGLLIASITHTASDVTGISNAHFQMGTCDKELNQNCVGTVSQNNQDPTVTNRHQNNSIVWQSTNDSGVIDQQVKVNIMKKGLIQLERILNTDNAEAILFFIVVGNKFDGRVNLRGNFSRNSKGGFQ